MAANIIHTPLPKLTTKSAPEKRELMLFLTLTTRATSAAKTTVERIAVIMATISAMIGTGWDSRKRDNMKVMAESPALTRCDTRRVNRVVFAISASLEESPTRDKMLVGMVYPNCGP